MHIEFSTVDDHKELMKLVDEIETGKRVLAPTSKDIDSKHTINLTTR